MRWWCEASTPTLALPDVFGYYMQRFFDVGGFSSFLFGLPQAHVVVKGGGVFEAGVYL